MHRALNEGLLSSTYSAHCPLLNATKIYLTFNEGLLSPIHSAQCYKIWFRVPEGGVHKGLRSTWTGTHEASAFLYIQRSDMIWSHNRKTGDSKWSKSQMKAHRTKTTILAFLSPSIYQLCILLISLSTVGILDESMENINSNSFFLLFI